MIEVSLCMIVKNEETVIGRCLQSVEGIFDEIIIIDTGSTDSTKEIVSQFTDKIYDFKWIDDFAAARNYSFSKATKEYVMWLDADDILKEKDVFLLKELKKTLDPSVSMVMMKYDVAFDSNGNPTFSYFRERLMKRNPNLKWEGPIHEVISPFGNVIHSEIAVSHNKIKQNEPQRNLKIFEKMISNGILLDPRQKFYYARELYYNEKYIEAVSVFNDFLNCEDGWIENKINACKDLSDCYLSLNDSKLSLSALLKSLEYDSPRAEICCEIAKHFLGSSKIQIAIFWYKLALSQKPNYNSGGFQQLDYYDFIPTLQLCVCYDKLGDTKTAMFYNEKAAELKPNHEAVKYNREYFSHLTN